MASNEIRVNEMWLCSLHEPRYALVVAGNKIVKAFHEVRLYMYMN
jgi:hypothetical protein